MGQLLTTQSNEVKAALEKGRVLLGIACYVVAWKGQPDINPTSWIPLLRLHNQGIDDYLYTTSQAEADQAAKIGYVFEAIVCNLGAPNLQASGSLVPLSRLYNPQTGEHFYTKDGTIINQRLQAGFQAETSPGFVFDPYRGAVPAWDTSVPLYRLSHIGATLPQFMPWYNSELL
jgi:hypothetical protein